MAETNGQASKPSLIMLMAFACGISVANLCYSQPLLFGVMRDLGASVQQVGLIPMHFSVRAGAVHGGG